MKTVVAIVACPTYELASLEKALEETLALVGGASAFFKRGERVLIKPNLLTTAGPEEAVTTHPTLSGLS